ncbi:hypothetical protein T484DRAFT_1866325 [Baffinella frigidus]|nr:hypothetical protein T484DRAFT_1866325 [Cryptophyta sp. CCMP2293]
MPGKDEKSLIALLKALVSAQDEDGRVPLHYLVAHPRVSKEVPTLDPELP